MDRLSRSDRAVTPVVGVVLMLAITVLLGAVIGTFVLGLSADVNAVPSTSFSFDYDRSTGEVTVVHETGDRITETNTNSLVVRVRGSVEGERIWTNRGGAGVDAMPLGPGASFTVDDTSADLLLSSDVTSGDEVRVVWRSVDGGESHVLARYEVP